MCSSCSSVHVGKCQAILQFKILDSFMSIICHFILLLVGGRLMCYIREKAEILPITWKPQSKQKVPVAAARHALILIHSGRSTRLLLLYSEPLKLQDNVWTKANKTDLWKNHLQEMVTNSHLFHVCRYSDEFCLSSLNKEENHTCRKYRM